MMAGLLLDLRHAFRLYRKTPWQSALAVVTMAVAMALVSTMASLWSDLYLGPARGVEKPAGLITFGRVNERDNSMLGAGLVREFAEQTRTLSGITGESLMSFQSSVEVNGEPVSGRSAAVLPGYFEILTPRMTRGRGLDAGDFADDGARVLVLGHAFWQDHFDGNPAIVGREIRLGEHDWRVVGIADEAFTGIGATKWLFWAPWKRYFLDFNAHLGEQIQDMLPFWRLAGRLADDASVAAARSELAQFIDALPDTRTMMAAPAAEITALSGLIDNVHEHRAAQRQVSLMLAAAILIAVVAATNLGTFLLARVPGRRREFALKQAVGASRRRLAGQLLVESSLVVVTSTLLGLVVSLWLSAAFRALRLFEQVHFGGGLINGPALAFLALLCAGVALIVALVPLTLIRRQGLIQAAAGASARPGAFQHGAGLLHLALSGLVAAAAIAFLTHLWIVGQRDMGFDERGVTAVTVGFQTAPGAGFQPPADEAVYSYRAEIRERLGALPGVEQISFTSPLPGQKAFAISTYRIDDAVINPHIINVAPGFFELLRINLLEGRGFQHDGEPGVVISREFARQAWPDQSALGRFISQDKGGAGYDDHRVIGVVDNVQYRHPEQPPIPLVFTSTGGFAAFMNGVLIRGRPDPDRIEQEVAAALETHFDQLTVVSVKPLSAIVAELTARDRARARITLLFAAVIVAMSGFGFFAMQRFLVDAGRRETAIRMALGAGPKSIRRHVVLQGLKLGLPGAIIGTLLAVVTTHWLIERYLSDAVSPPGVAAAVGGGLLALLILASLQPAIAAARLRPADLLREE